MDGVKAKDDYQLFLGCKLKKPLTLKTAKKCCARLGHSLYPCLDCYHWHTTKNWTQWGNGSGLVDHLKGYRAGWTNGNN